MERSSKRGKIPQNDWPSIISRYEAGETLASIARTYDCSPPAISYIVSRTRARSGGREGALSATIAPAPADPHLVKTPAPPVMDDLLDRESMKKNEIVEGEASLPVVVERSDRPEHAADPDPMPSEMPSEAAPAAEPPSANSDPSQTNSPDAEITQKRAESSQTSQDSETGAEAERTDTGPAPSAQSGSQTADGRRTLHLSLPQGNGAADPALGYPGAHNSVAFGHSSDSRAAPRNAAGQPGLGLPPRQQPGPSKSQPATSPLGAARAPAAQSDNPQKSRDSVGFIDQALRDRLSDDIAAFLAAFDAALDHDTAESRTGLREATDRLLRAGARTRIELERMEARLPLGAREANLRSMSAARPR